MLSEYDFFKSFSQLNSFEDVIAVIKNVKRLFKLKTFKFDV